VLPNLNQTNHTRQKKGPPSLTALGRGTAHHQRALTYGAGLGPGDFHMDKKLLCALGAASTLAIVAGGPAAANVNPVPSLNPAQSFAELLDPIPNAAETLASMDENPPQKLKQAGIQLVQYHHHHHHHYRRYYHHHHHHHYY
jgi:hypothetical protein